VPECDGYSGGGKDENGGKFCWDWNPLAELFWYAVDAAEGGYDCEGVTAEL
jgi:hypothetical protein